MYAAIKLLAARKDQSHIIMKTQLSERQNFAERPSDSGEQNENFRGKEDGKKGGGFEAGLK